MAESASLQRGDSGKRTLGGRSWLFFLGWMAALTAAYATAHVVGPHWLNSGSVFNLIGLSAVAAILVGARSNPAGRRLPWYLFALGQALFVLGDVLAYNYQRLFGRPLPFPSIADASISAAASPCSPVCCC